MSNEIIVKSDFTPDQVDLIKKTICPGSTNDELKVFLHVANKVQLDPFLRQIYSIERKSQNNGQWVKTRQIMISIDGQRLVAERSGKYAGQLGPFFCGDDGKWIDIWTKKTPPYASKVGVLRSDFKEPVWGIAIFESYVQLKTDGTPNKFWKQFPELMIGKVAEALALRKAFPQYLAGLYTQEEMDQDESPKVEYKENYINQDMREKKVKDVKFDAPKEVTPPFPPEPEPEPITAPKTYSSFSFGQFKGKAINEVPVKDVKSYIKFLQEKDFKFDTWKGDFFHQVAEYIGDDSFLKPKELIIQCWSCGESYVSSLPECANCGKNEADQLVTTEEIPW